MNNKKACRHKWLCEKMISYRNSGLQYCTTKYVCDKCGETNVRTEVINIKNGICHGFVEWK